MADERQNIETSRGTKIKSLTGKVAVVTGACGGIGQCLVKSLVEETGMTVVGLSNREKKLQEMMETLQGSFHFILCDLEQEADILEAFQKIEEQFRRVDVLVNCAGYMATERIIEGTTANFRTMLNINVLAVAICTREAVKLMRKRDNYGHIICMNSLSGHNASSITVPISLYAASKYAITGMCESIRAELNALKSSKIKLTSISPGGCKTDMIMKFGVHKKDFPYAPLLDPEDIRDAILYALGTPRHVHVNEVMLETPLHYTPKEDDMEKTE